MSKLIKHKWEQNKFGVWTCVKCGCIKTQTAKTYRSEYPFPQYYYFRSGIQLASLPEYKSTFHCDSVIN